MKMFLDETALNISVRVGSTLLRGLLEEALRSRGSAAVPLGHVTVLFDTPNAPALVVLEQGVVGLTLVVTDNPCGEYWCDILQLAPLGLLIAPTTIKEVVTAVVSVAKGIPYLNRPIYESPLWARERRVLRLLADGYEGDAIASKLGVKPAVVRNYTSSILMKLRLNHPQLTLENRVQLVNYYWGITTHTSKPVMFVS